MNADLTAIGLSGPEQRLLFDALDIYRLTMRGDDSAELADVATMAEGSAYVSELMIKLFGTDE